MKGFSAELPLATYKDVFEKLDEEDIYMRYVPGLVINGTIPSPIGKPDKHPSFSVFWSYRKHKYLFKDHRYGYTGDCIDLVRYIFGYPSNVKACMRIMHDFGIQGYQIDDDISSNHIIHEPKTKKIVKQDRVNLRVQVRAWQKHDLDYWGQFGITEEWLKFGSIYPIKFFFFDSTPYRADKYAYVYVEKKDGKVTYKIYQPYSTTRKWISNNNHSVWELWSKLPKTGDFVIITKSRKDALSIMATAGIPSTSLQAEGTIPKNHVVDELKIRFKVVLLFYDNDYDSDENYGQIYCEKLSNQTKLQSIHIPSKYEAKDYTDFIQKYSIKEARMLLWNLIKAKLLCEGCLEKIVFQN